MTIYVDSQKLKTIINEKNWDQLLKSITPKYFVNDKSMTRELPDARILAQICQVLVNEITPDEVKVLCLKCLGNSCLDGYKYKQHTVEDTKSDKYNKILYNKLSENNSCEHRKDCDYPHDSHFPYDGVTEWAVDYIKANATSKNSLFSMELDLVRLSIQFLCNLFTFACPDATSENNILRYLNCDNLKQAILNNMQSVHRPLAHAACVYVHNALTKLHNYFANDDKSLCLFVQLLKPAKIGFSSAKDALLYLLHRSDVFEDLYYNVEISEKLYLLEMIYNELWESWQSDSIVLADNQAEFLAITFCKRSDLILKIMDTYVDSVDPTEVILILKILGILTTRYKISENAKPLLINCKYLLMSLHLIGKESDNYFTPITNLSKINLREEELIVPNEKTIDASPTSEATTTKCDPQDHPAYSFKAGLIRIIANLVHKNKMLQDLCREIDGIPLLLDCCKIDARNPYILQWTIFALRNLCEGNLENQEIIKNCKKEGVVDNSVLQEMGLTLHEDADGKSIRVVPLRRD